MDQRADHAEEAVGPRPGAFDQRDGVGRMRGGAATDHLGEEEPQRSQIARRVAPAARPKAEQDRPIARVDLHLGRAQGSVMHADRMGGPQALGDVGGQGRGPFEAVPEARPDHSGERLSVQELSGERPLPVLELDPVVDAAHPGARDASGPLHRQLEVLRALEEVERDDLADLAIADAEQGVAVAVEAFEELEARTVGAHGPLPLPLGLHDPARDPGSVFAAVFLLGFDAGFAVGADRAGLAGGIVGQIKPAPTAPAGLSLLAEGFVIGVDDAALLEGTAAAEDGLGIAGGEVDGVFTPTAAALDAARHAGPVLGPDLVQL